MTCDLNVMIHFRSLAEASGYDFVALYVRANESAQLQSELVSGRSESGKPTPEKPAASAVNF
jgi:hypothetical protein